MPRMPILQYADLILFLNGKLISAIDAHDDEMAAKISAQMAQLRANRDAGK